LQYLILKHRQVSPFFELPVGVKDDKISPLSHGNCPLLTVYSEDLRLPLAAVLHDERQEFVLILLFWSTFNPKLLGSLVENGPEDWQSEANRRYAIHGLEEIATFFVFLRYRKMIRDYGIIVSILEPIYHKILLSLLPYWRKCFEPGISILNLT